MTIRYQDHWVNQAGFIRIVRGAASRKAVWSLKGVTKSMSVTTPVIAPEYLSIYVAGRRNVKIPLHMDKQGIFSSPDCINVPALYWNDGDTHVTFGPASEITEARKPDFEGILNTSDKELILFDANEPQYAIADVPSTKTRIRVWIDHPTEPEYVIIAWG